jgi:hypothetical protein
VMVGGECVCIQSDVCLVRVCYARRAMTVRNVLHDNKALLSNICASYFSMRVSVPTC